MVDLFALSEGLGTPFKLLTSLAIGLLLGLQRERTPSAKAGLRTFALVALLGTTAGLVANAAGDTWIVAAGLVLVGLMIIAAYRGDENSEADSGTTTVVAVLLCYMLGVMVWYDQSLLAVGVAIAATLLLHFKTELHGLSARLSRQDVASILQFAVLTFVFLPLLPDENYGPYQALNPYHIWLIVVLVSGISLAGYLALRLFGAKASLPLVGISGGLVSSTATVLVYARQARDHASMVPVAGGIITISNLVVLARLAVLSAVVAAPALPVMLPVFFSGAALGLLPLLHRLRTTRAAGELKVPEFKNPTNLRVAVGFGALYALVLLASAWLSERAGSQGLYAIAVASGFVDVDAIALSSLKLLGGGMVTAQVAATAIALAYGAAVAFKLAVLIVAGGRDLLRYCAPSLLASVGGVAASILVFA
jgi:uncharacterized membrane protein (DUF4010 family)